MQGFSVQILKIPTRGRLILLCWAGAGGAGLLGLFFLYSAFLLRLGGVVLAAALVWLWWYSARYRILLSALPSAQGAPLLTLSRGRLLRKEYHIPCRAIYSYGSYTTPLLRRAGCCVFVCHTARHSFFFPPFAQQDLAPLLAYLGDVA